MALRLVVDPGRKFRNKLRHWEEGFRDLRWAWPHAAPAIARVHAEAFDLEGPGWKPLAEATVTYRATGYGYYGRPSIEGADERILHWTHSLRDSLASPKSTRLSYRMAGRQRMLYGTKHHAGAELHTQRPFLRPQYAVAAVAEVFRKLIPSWMNKSKTGRPPAFGG